jgi:imidazolonepropionase-like amidohydrolase
LPSKGRIVVNSDADLLVVRGDVSSDIASITRPIRVWHRGILV